MFNRCPLQIRQREATVKSENCLVTIVIKNFESTLIFTYFSSFLRKYPILAYFYVLNLEIRIFPFIFAARMIPKNETSYYVIFFDWCAVSFLCLKLFT